MLGGLNKAVSPDETERSPDFGVGVELTKPHLSIHNNYINYCNYCLVPCIGHFPSQLAKSQKYNGGTYETVKAGFWP